MGSCVAQRKQDKTYYEDLSSMRPRVDAPLDTPLNTIKTEVIPNHPNSIVSKITVNEKVDAVLDSIDQFNLIKRSTDGFTIQVYSGQKREEAMNTKKEITNAFPELTSNLQYQQPKFRVTVGRYFTKLEAQQDLNHLRKVFPSAILVPEKIAIR
jgi:hypothetical protein